MIEYCRAPMLFDARFADDGMLLKMFSEFRHL